MRHFGPRDPMCSLWMSTWLRFFHVLPCASEGEGHLQRLSFLGVESSQLGNGTVPLEPARMRVLKRRGSDATCCCIPTPKACLYCVFFDLSLSLSLSLSLAQKRVPVDFDSLQAGSDLRMDDFMTFVLWTALLRWHLGRHLS